MTGDSGSQWYWFGLGMLAVWRTTHLLHVEHGPWGWFERMRQAAPRSGLGEVFACFFCLSLWIAAVPAWWLAPDWPRRVLTWLALSAAAILIEVRGMGAPPIPPPTDQPRETKEP